MAQFAIILLIATIVGVWSACENACSGHGVCNGDEVCECYDNYGVGLAHDSGDCSERTCPFELAWVDSPDFGGARHKYTECAGRGLCDRTTGQCQCFDGFEGKACKRMSCPNDCSGHGTCEFIEELTFEADFDIGFMSGGKLFDYRQWDMSMSRQCVCDASYFDVDCSKRMCPYGNDALDTRDNLLISQKFQVQQIIISPTGNAASLHGMTFALIFKSRTNETYTTYPIVVDASDLHDFANDIKIALMRLPNKVITGVEVQAGQENGGLNDLINVNITFTGDSVQGPQHLLKVEDFECSSGCTPRITGLAVETVIGTPFSNITETQLADFNSYECGRRGKCDYESGLCQCFTGYTGKNCDTCTTLV